MSFISEDFICTGCQIVWDQLVPREERDSPVKCPECEQMTGHRTIATPRSLMQKGAIHMGAKRKGFQDLKESYDLEVKAADLRPDSQERKEVSKEIRRLRKVTT